MPQNIYDQPEFFEGYSRFERSIEGLAGAPEWPRLRGMVPSLAGLRVLDLGCGFGAFARWAAEQGARQVLGIDLSSIQSSPPRRIPNGLIANGFRIERLEEWGPSDARIAENPEWADEIQRPPFLLIGASVRA